MNKEYFIRWNLENLRSTQLSDSQFFFYYCLPFKPWRTFWQIIIPIIQKIVFFIFSKSSWREMSEAWASGGHLFRQTGTTEISNREHQTLVSINNRLTCWLFNFDAECEIFMIGLTVLSISIWIRGPSTSGQHWLTVYSAMCDVEHIWIRGLFAPKSYCRSLWSRIGFLHPTDDLYFMSDIICNISYAKCKTSYNMISNHSG